MTIAPQDRGVVSKTQTFDDTVVVDEPAWLGELLGKHSRKLQPSSPLFQSTAVEFQKLFQDSLAHLWWAYARPSSYSNAFEIVWHSSVGSCQFHFFLNNCVRIPIGCASLRLAYNYLLDDSLRCTTDRWAAHGKSTFAKTIASQAS